MKTTDPIQLLAAVDPLSPEELEREAAARDRTFALLVARRHLEAPAQSRRERPSRAARTRRRALAALTTGAVAIAAAVVGVTTPWHDSNPFRLERALAVIGSGPVIHAVVETSAPGAVVVDLRSGAERPRMQRNEYWYDRQRAALRTRLSIDGMFLSEVVETPEGADADVGHIGNGGRYRPQLEPALSGFVTRYRSALRGGQADVIGETTVDGREAVLLRITGLDADVLPRGGYEQVTLDADTYRPLTFQYFEASGLKSVLWRVVAIESLPRDPSLFAKPALSSPRPTASDGGVGGRGVTVDEAKDALGRTAVWAGRETGGLPLIRQRLVTSEVRWTDGRT
ncbi:MAG: hypothetical protein M3322_01155, partial [Actinomycetota bacterium]|nr:hypothetical protein [Actinomycetota bacterium]